MQGEEGMKGDVNTYRVKGVDTYRVKGVNTISVLEGGDIRTDIMTE